MPEPGERLKGVLDGYATFLRTKDLAPSNQQPHLLNSPAALAPGEREAKGKIHSPFQGAMTATGETLAGSAGSGRAAVPIPVKLLYGTGLRPIKLLRLLVKDLDFDAGLVVIHGGKGDNDRATLCAS